jgi:UDP-N-acetylmuramoyl-L-alanyl-D-glutamate--2,6-diaminopimelate ligase
MPQPLSHPLHPLHQLHGTAQAVAWLRARGVAAMHGALRTDSREVQPGDRFLAWPGATHDGRQHVQAALQQGAVACLVEAAGAEAFAFDDPRVAALPGLKAAAGAIADEWSGHPSQAVRMLAVTGTNGKTSTSWWLAQALAALGTRCAVAGTLGVGEPVHAGAAGVAPAPLRSTGLTTPDAVALHASLRALADDGVQACAIEASSIGIEEHRLDGLHIDVALFTNLTQDHLDYHGSMDRYWAAKRRLFAWPGLRAAVLNIDDAHGARLAEQLHGSALQLWTVALDGGPARLQGLNLRHDDAGLAFDVQEAGAPATAEALSTPVAVRSALVGRFNASNLLLVLGGLRALGVPLQDACAALSALVPPPGRMQRVSAAAAPPSLPADGGAAAQLPHDDVEVIVDYAHTPDALEKVLQSLAPLAAARGGRLWCVVGCGGDRDAGKRPLMAAAAARLAQQVVLTSDNPRSEDPARILQQMLTGIVDPQALHQRVVVIEDRRAAIQHAVQRAASGDVVLLAGKGHEQTQEVAGVKRPFSDTEEARQALRARVAAPGVAAC